MASKNGSVISRREFARRAALASAAASLSPAELLTSAPTVAATPLPQTSTASKLSLEGQAEVDSRVQAIFSRYGTRLNDAQKADLQRLAAEGQAMLDHLRAFATDNSDGPALYLKPLMEREKKPSSKFTTAAKQPPAPKSS